MYKRQAILTAYKYTKYKPFPGKVKTPEVVLHPIEVKARAYEAGMVAVAKTFSPFGHWSSGESPNLKGQKTVTKGAGDNFVQVQALSVKEKETTQKEGVVGLVKKRELEAVQANKESEKQNKKIRQWKVKVRWKHRNSCVTIVRKRKTVSGMEKWGRR